MLRETYNKDPASPRPQYGPGHGSLRSLYSQTLPPPGPGARPRHQHPRPRPRLRGGQVCQVQGGQRNSLAQGFI